MAVKTEPVASPHFAGGLHAVGADTFAWLQPNGGLGESNAGLVVGDGEALLIDTFWDLPRTRRMLDDFAPLLSGPIRTLVNTHGDPDHTWGNQLVPGAQIVATQAAADVFLDERPPVLRVISAAGRRVGPRGGNFLPVFGQFDFRGVKLTPPTRTFSGECSLDIGGREVRLIEVGPAHSPGDLIVSVPDASVVFAADIVMFGGLWPVMWAGPMGNWLAGLERVIELGPGQVVPGHGPVCTVDDVVAMRALMLWIDGRANAALAGGLSVRDATLSVLAAAEEERGPWSGLEGVEPLFITVATIDRHRRGGGPLTPSTRLRTMLGAARTAAFVARRDRSEA